MIAVYGFAAVGAVVCGLFLLVILHEAWRALRASRRVAKVIARLSGRRKASLPLWASCFRDEFFASYSRKRIGHFVLDYDPDKPVRPCR